MRKNNETKQHTNVVLLFFVTLIVFLMLSPISSVTAHAAKNTVSIGKTGQSVYITFSLEKSSQIDHYYITISDNYGTYITGGADIFLDHLPINVRDGSSCYKSKTSSVLKWAHSSK